MRLHLRLSVALVALFAGGSGGAVAAPPAPTSAADLYVRGSRNIPQTVERIVADASVPAESAFLFVFEAATFSPPQGETGFTALYGFHQDVEAWAKAVATEGAKRSDRPLLVATSARPEPLPVMDDLSARKALDLIRYRWTDDPAFKPFRPVADWLPDLVRLAKRTAKRDALVVVYVADAVPAERFWATSSSSEPLLNGGPGQQDEWTQKLSPDGTYFDEEAVARALGKAGARLFVVAPEVLFEDFTPFLELPSLPWAARPQLPGAQGEVDQLVEDLGELLRKGLGLPGQPTTPGDKLPGASPLPLLGRRFESHTPTWFPRVGERIPWCNHVPSFFGHWPYARAAAQTGGRYLFYPFAPSPWLDVCPTDARLLNDLAPELVERSAFARVGAGDLAWDALDRAARRVVDDTPWSDGVGREASGWGSFESRRPVKLEKRWRARQRPYDDIIGGNTKPAEDWRKEGRRIVAEVVPRYSAAIRDLDDALEKGNVPGAHVHPRGRADLTLGRFWMAMSRFHLHALGLYASEIDRFRPANATDKNEYWFTYVDAVKLSDCLDAYDGRVLTPELEATYASFAKEARHPHTQDNILPIPLTSPDYRAKRDLERVLKNLDPRLRDDALDMIEAARRVMERYAKTPWGWTVYYSVADTFIWEPVPEGEGLERRRGDPAKPDRPPTTPKDKEPKPKEPKPTTPGGGSNPGGPGSTPGGPTTGK